MTKVDQSVSIEEKGQLLLYVRIKSFILFKIESTIYIYSHQHGFLQVLLDTYIRQAFLLGAISGINKNRKNVKLYNIKYSFEFS